MIDTYDKIPSGIEALTRRMEDRTVPGETRAELLRIAEQLSIPYSRSEPRNSTQGWEETLYRVTTDGATITGTASETIMVPDFTLDANYLTVGKTLRYTLMCDVSTAITTPGTQIYRLRWGGVGGVSLAASGAFAPDTVSAATTVTQIVEWWMTGRAEGTSGSAYCIGRITWNDWNFATVATIGANLNMMVAPASAPAASTIDTTIAKALSATWQLSVTTGSLRCHLAILEAMN